MIRFSCSKCQKVLSAPDDKVGVKVTCPGCRSLIAVPASGPVASSQVVARPNPPQPATTGVTRKVPAPPGAPPEQRVGSPSAGAALRLWKRGLGECGEVGKATLRQSVRPVSFLFVLKQRNKLRRKAEEARFALGMKMHEEEVGDQKVRGQISKLGEKIVNIQAVKGQSGPVEAERRVLVNKLADSALKSASVPASIAEEHQKACTLRDKLAAVENDTKGALGGLLPAGFAAWRRVTIGYGLAFCVLGLVFLFHMRSANAARLVREKEDQRAAQEKVIQDKREAEEAVWLRDKKEPEEIVALCGPSVAKIAFKIGDREGGGTGFMIRPGIVATNAHVIEGALPDELKVYFPSAPPDIKKNAYPCKVLYFDAKRDLAFLSVEPIVPKLRMADKFEFRSGQKITVIGCPGIGEKMLENAVSVGVLSTKTDVRKQAFYQMGISVNPGNSGGPVFDSRGMVVGVVTLKSFREGISFCVPWEDLQKAIDTLEKANLWKDIPQTQAQHALHVVKDRLVNSAEGCSFAMKIYAIRMAEAASRNRPLDEGISRAKPETSKIFEIIDKQVWSEKIRAVSARLRTDPRLPEAARKNYGDLFNTYTELRSCVEKPVGPLNSYVAKVGELNTQFGKQLKQLATSLGTEVDEEEK